MHASCQHWQRWRKVLYCTKGLDLPCWICGVSCSSGKPELALWQRVTPVAFMVQLVTNAMAAMGCTFLPESIALGNLLIQHQLPLHMQGWCSAGCAVDLCWITSLRNWCMPQNRSSPLNGVLIHGSCLGWNISFSFQINQSPIISCIFVPKMKRVSIFICGAL